MSLNRVRAEAQERGPGIARGWEQPGLKLGQACWERWSMRKRGSYALPAWEENPKSELAAESGGPAAPAPSRPRPTSWARVLRGAPFLVPSPWQPEPASALGSLQRDRSRAGAGAHTPANRGGAALKACPRGRDGPRLPSAGFSSVLARPHRPQSSGLRSQERRSCPGGLHLHFGSARLRSQLRASGGRRQPVCLSVPRRRSSCALLPPCGRSTPRTLPRLGAVPGPFRPLSRLASVAGTRGCFLPEQAVNHTGLAVASVFRWKEW